MKITAVVILYNTTIKNSQTLCSLLKCELSHINLSLNIWNNGPSLLIEDEIKLLKKECETLGINLNIYQNIQNIALSHIYNYLIEKSEFNFFTILDQDSNLEKDFFNNIYSNHNYDLIVPEIYASGWREKEETKCFPTYLGSEILLEKQTFILGEIFTISSGITLSNKLIDILQENDKTVFNNNFALYGIDTSFFYNLKNLLALNLQGICVGTIKHNLAHNRFSTAQLSETRKLEMEYDNILQRIYCNHKSTFSTLIFLLKKLISRKYSLQVFKKLLVCLINKKHPRTNIQISTTIEESK